jgi:predicted metal-dependent hydrolase
MTAESEQRVHFGQYEIGFALLRSDRRTLGISVLPDGSVVVRAPTNSTLLEILPRVEKRAGWILAQRSRAARYRPRTPARTYEEGETHLHLGRQYRLSVQRGLRQDVRIEGDRLVLFMHRPEHRDERAELLRGWRLKEARSLYPRRLAGLLPPFVTYGVSHPKVVIRDLTHRWGSLTKAGNMLLSRDLIRAPQPCIDYVIVHELCHFVHEDHGDGFWQLLNEVMPDHALRKARLEQVLL